MLNTSCILLLGQPSDAYYACSLINVFLALRTIELRNCIEKLSSQHPKPETSLEPVQLEFDTQKNCPFMTFQVFLKSWNRLPTPGLHLSLYVGWKKRHWITESSILPLQASSSSYSSFHIFTKNSCVRPYQLNLCNNKSLKFFLCL